MGKREDMLKQLQSERQTLPGGLQTLIRGGEGKPQTIQKEKEVKESLSDETAETGSGGITKFDAASIYAAMREQITSSFQTETAEKGKVGRPKSNFNDFHTSLVIDHDLYLRMKHIALEQGGRSIKEIINEALVTWVETNK